MIERTPTVLTYVVRTWYYVYMKVTIWIRKENEDKWREVCSSFGGSEWINGLLESSSRDRQVETILQPTNGFKDLCPHGSEKGKCTNPICTYSKYR